MKIIDMEGLLVRVVDNLVSTSASEVSEGDEVLKTQAHFYRVLIANCERKAEMAEATPSSVPPTVVQICRPNGSRVTTTNVFDPPGETRT
jgi:hypothetical protein